MTKSKLSPDVVEQIVKRIHETVASEKATLTEVLELKNAIIQKAKTGSTHLEEFVNINESVNSIMSAINEIETLTQAKLKYLKQLVHQIEFLRQSTFLKK